MKRTRRQFVHESASLGLLIPLLGCGTDHDSSLLGPANLFAHGVASGDPLADAVILWTRLSPADPDSETTIPVAYEIGLDPALTDIITEGSTETDADRDFTVHVDATGLEAGTTYYYRFSARGRTSSIGRTRTAPKGSLSRLRLAVMSCSNYAFGYFHAYRHAAQRGDLDAVLHLGDYCYEYGDNEYGSARSLQPAHEVVSLSDYRTRYAHYRSDPDLQAVHQQLPFIAVWDDHEYANDAYLEGAENHDDSEGSFADRRAAALQAYREWMPVRGLDAEGQIYRAFGFGDLVDLFMLDTRMWARVAQARDNSTELNDPERTLLGQDQQAWLAAGLDDSTARWRIIGQQVVLFQMNFGGAPVNNDQWDGYPVARERFFDTLQDGGYDNVVVLTGDIHASGASALVADPDTYDPDNASNRLGVEFITPGVTSPFLTGSDIPEELADLAPLLSNPELVVSTVTEMNPHIHWADGTHQGYMVLDITDARIQAEWYHYTMPERSELDVAFAKAFVVENGSYLLSEADTPSDPPSESPELAPTPESVTPESV